MGVNEIQEGWDCRHLDPPILPFRRLSVDLKASDSCDVCADYELVLQVIWTRYTYSMLMKPLRIRNYMMRCAALSIPPPCRRNRKHTHKHGVIANLCSQHATRWERSIDDLKAFAGKGATKRNSFKQSKDDPALLSCSVDGILCHSRRATPARHDQIAKGWFFKHMHCKKNKQNTFYS